MNLEIIARRVAQRSKTAESPGGNLEMLGMSAEFGQDESMTSTHTHLKNDDIECFDTRPDAGGELFEDDSIFETDDSE